MILLILLAAIAILLGGGYALGRLAAIFCSSDGLLGWAMKMAAITGGGLALLMLNLIFDRLLGWYPPYVSLALTAAYFIISLGSSFAAFSSGLRAGMGASTAHETRLRDAQQSVSIPVLLPLLKDRDAGIRWRAAQRLGSLRERQAVQQLIAVLSDPDRLVRYAAATALGDIGDQSATVPLMDATRDPQTGHAAILALGKLKAPQALPLLLGLLNDRRLAYAAAQSLGFFGDAAAVDPLIAIIRAPKRDKHLLHATAEALGKLYKQGAMSYTQKGTLLMLADTIVGTSHNDEGGNHTDASGIEPRTGEPAHGDYTEGSHSDSTTELRLKDFLR